MIKEIWLQQPLAFARCGSSPTPLAAFRWTEPDLRPHGTGRTSVAPAPSYEIGGDGGVNRLPDSNLTLFRDEHGIRPVCPFFELHADWDGRNGASTALTEQVLRDNGLALADLTWSIHHANLKAYALTKDDGDRIEARLSVKGDDHVLHPIIGSSPTASPTPLVPANPGIPMGALQLARPSAAEPTIRLRFIAPQGHAYGPSDLKDKLVRSNGLLDWVIGRFKLNDDWKGFDLPGRLFLNPKSAWPAYRFVTYGQALSALPRIVTRLRSFLSLCRHVQRSELLRFVLGPNGNSGKLPPGLFAYRYGLGAVLSSLGLVDDLGDGIITCELKGVGKAHARIAVGPPHFSPDRRPPVSIADALTDRTLRADVRAPDWADDANWASARSEMYDLLDRAYETAALSNLDAWNDELNQENESDAVYRPDPNPPDQPGKLLWGDMSAHTVLDLPLSELARWRHRRNTSHEFFEQLLRDSRNLMHHWIRDPSDDRSLYYDKRMPALMRGSDRRPLHLTRRQLGAFSAWLKRLRDEKS